MSVPSKKPAHPTVPPRLHATVRGRIVDARGDAVQGVEVGWTDAHPDSRPESGDLEFLQISTTDEKGRYEANLLPPGPCRMVAGWPNVPFNRRMASQDLPSTPIVRLRNGGVTIAPDICLPVDPRILGTIDVIVVDPEGRPMRGTDVYCSNGIAPWGNRRSSDTDEHGRIRFGAVCPGQAEVSVPGGSPWRPAVRRVWMPPGVHRRLTVSLTRLGRSRGARKSVRVVCRDDAGRPLPGCRVHVYGFDAKSHMVMRRSGPRGAALLAGHLRLDGRGEISGSAWKLGYESVHFQADAESGERILQIETTLRRLVNLYFRIVDGVTRSPLQRPSIEIQPDSKWGGTWMGGAQGIISAAEMEPSFPPKFAHLLLPSHGVPTGRVTIRVATPGYEPKVMVLRLPSGRKYVKTRMVDVRLIPAHGGGRDRPTNSGFQEPPIGATDRISSRRRRP